MVDVLSSPPLVKLVDFGDSVNIAKNVILPPACLEFASPELVLGQPVGRHTDCWAAGKSPNRPSPLGTNSNLIVLFCRRFSLRSP